MSTTNTHRPRNTTLLATALALTTAPPPAHAINIIMNFDSANSATPAFDSDGSLLTDLFDYAEDYYQSIFEDSSHTLTIDFRYTNLSGTQLGLHTYGTSEFPFGAGREATGLIEIDTNPSNGWFIDPTPGNDSEFNMTQTFWRDLSNAQRTDWYNFGADIPDTFEVGYTGTAPATSAANGSTDMLTTILHEVGHALGMSGANPLTIVEVGTDLDGDGDNDGDGDYDYNPDFIAGKTLAIEAANTTGDDNLNIPHVESAFAMMTPTVPVSLRSRPSHSDLFAMATVNYYDNDKVDVPRKEFYQNSNWQNPDNWSGHRKPDSGDDVYIRAAQGAGTNLTARLNSANGVADDLFVSEGANFRTDAFKLTVDDDVFVTDADSDIFINPGGEVQADHVVIQNNAEIEMNGGTLDTRRVTIEPTAQLEGRTNTMTVDVSERLTVGGKLVVTDGAHMTLTSIAASPWNLDGSASDGDDGIVDANNGDLTFSGGNMTDGFSGTMRIGAAHFIDFPAAWTLNTGTLDLNGGTTFANRARLDGGTLTKTGGVISASGISHINPDFVNSGGNVNVDTDAELEINGTSNISAGNFTVFPDGFLDFDNATTVSGGFFDLDPSARINFDSTTTINGSPTFDLNTGALVQINGPVTFSGTPTFITTSSSTANGLLEINGTTTYNGGTITINGAARQDGNATVSSETTINATTFLLDGTTNPTWTINKPLTVNADSVALSDGFLTNVVDATFNINNNGNLFIAGGRLTINLPGESFTTLNGTINLDGSLPPDTIIPNLIDGSPAFISGTVNVQDRAAIHARTSIAGTVNINADSLLNLNGGDLTENNVLIAATINGPGTLGATTSNALIGNGTINAPIRFLGTSKLLANSGELTITDAILDAGTIGTASDTGILNVTNAWNTNTTDLVQLNGGSIIGGTITNPLGQTISGFGTLAPTQIVNNGTISADGGELILDYTNNPDLDGFSPSNGIINAINGDLTIVDPATDAHNGTANVGATRTMDFQGGWTLGNGGVLNLDGGVGFSNRARVTGGTMTNSLGVINTTGLGYIDSTFNMATGTVNVAAAAELEFNGTTNISGGTFSVDTGGILDFDGPLTLSGSPIFNTPSGNVADGQVRFDGSNTTYDGPTLAVNGLARQSGNATVSDNTNINATVFDIDGNFTTPSTWTINRKLTINADNVETAGSNTVNSTFNINNDGTVVGPDNIGGQLVINLPVTTPWTLAGTANVTGNESTPSSVIPHVIQGSPVNITGTVNILHRASISATFDLTGNINTTNPADEFHISGGSIPFPNTLSGGTITGPGTLKALPAKALHGHGTIAITIDDDFDDLQIMADDGTLTINAPINSVGVIGTADTDGNLHTTVSWNTANATRLELNGGSVTGAGINNGTSPATHLITGHGTISVEHLNNRGKISANGGLLTINTNTFNPDLDGINTGVIEAVNGDLTIADPLNDAFDGTASVGNARTMTFQQGWTLNNAGTLNLAGGTTTATTATIDVPTPATQNIDGSASILNYASFDATSNINPSANITINSASRLYLNGDTNIAAGASVTGNGLLFNTPKQTLTLANGASLDVDLTNQGNIQVGASPGTATITEGVSFSNTSNVHIDVLLPDPINTRPIPGVDFDQINITRGLTLDGTLDIDPTHDATPNLGTNYPIFTYGAFRGMFDNINGTLINTSLALAPLFSTDNLTLRATIPGDLNLDNKVSVADLSTFALNFNTTPGLYNNATDQSSWQLGDFNTDGKITVADLSLLALNFGFELFPDGTTTAPTPLSIYTLVNIAGLDPTTIPEPTTLMLLSSTTCLLLLRRTRGTSTHSTKHSPNKNMTDKATDLI